MLASAIPASFPVPFAAAAGGGYIRPIPQASQIGIQDGAASLTDGFPPLTFLPVASGGTPPFGQDVNGVLNQVTAWAQWYAANGAGIYRSSAFSSAIGGYPAGAILASAVFPGAFWRSTADNNTSNPDAGGANWQQITRARLTGATTFYVNASTGNDSNTGLGSGTAWLTAQHAVNALQVNYDLNGQAVTVQFADGTYGAISVDGKFVGQSAGLAQITFNGNSGTPTNVLFTSAGSTISASNGAQFLLQNMKVQSTNGTASSAVVFADSAGALIGIGTGFVMGGNAPNGFQFNGNIVVLSNYTIAGSALNHFFVENNALIYIRAGLTITVTGTPAFTSFANVSNGGVIKFENGSSVFSGAATGLYFQLTTNAVIDTGTGNLTFLPGNAAGTTATGGQYV